VSPPGLLGSALCRSTMQRTATHCQLLRHTATHCDTIMTSLVPLHSLRSLAHLCI